MYRRRVLASIAASSVFAGCNGISPTGTMDGSGRTSTPPQTGSTNPTTVSDTLLRERDPPAGLSTVVRPPNVEPPGATEDTVPPLSYPDEPTSYDPETVEKFVETYERAYRRNDLLRDYGSRLIEQGFAFDWTRTLAVGEGAGVGRTQYRYNETVDRSDGIVVGDSATHLVTYYVDESVVVRAEVTGRRKRRDELVPDPWETGVVLEPSA